MLKCREPPTPREKKRRKRQSVTTHPRCVTSLAEGQTHYTGHLSRPCVFIIALFVYYLFFLRRKHVKLLSLRGAEKLGLKGREKQKQTRVSQECDAVTATAMSTFKAFANTANTTHPRYSYATTSDTAHHRHHHRYTTASLTVSKYSRRSTTYEVQVVSCPKAN